MPFCFGIVEGNAREQLGTATPPPGITCTPPPCSTGASCTVCIGECPDVYCVLCTATPTPPAPVLRKVYLPWLVRTVVAAP